MASFRTFLLSFLLTVLLLLMVSGESSARRLEVTKTPQSQSAKSLPYNPNEYGGNIYCRPFQRCTRTPVTPPPTTGRDSDGDCSFHQVDCPRIPTPPPMK